MSSDKPKFNRRRLLLYGALAGAGLAAAYAGGWYWVRVRNGDTEDLIVSILRRRLRGLQVAPEDMRDFARALQPRFAQHSRLAMLGMLGPIYERVNVYRFLPYSALSFRRFENQIVQEFLLSSDFFAEGADPARPVQYFGARDPVRRICDNPFAVFDPE